MAEKSLSPEIIKLMDKVTKDPASRYFVPLAEEYVKCDMLDEAVLVLMDGIKNNPNYLAGRVLLGKVYLQKKQIPEARVEFEHVIQINPENILAHKKMAQIHQGEGQLEKAIEACKKVLMIDPTDKETKALLATLEKESASALAPPAPLPSFAPPEGEKSPTPEAAPPEIPPEGAFLNPASEAAAVASPSQEEEAAFASPPMEEAPVPEIPKIEEAPLAPPPQAPPAMSPPEPSLSPPPSLETDALEGDEMEGERTVVAGFSAPSETPAVPPAASEGERAPEVGASQEELLSTTLASLYVSQGHYEKAIEVYKKLLALNPHDEELQQGLQQATERWAAARHEDAPGADAGRGPSRGKIQRLQSWLDSIRKDEGR